MKTLILSLCLLLPSFAKAQLPPLPLPAGAVVQTPAYSYPSAWGGKLWRGDMYYGLGGNRYIQRQISFDGGFSWQYDGSVQSIFIPTLVNWYGQFYVMNGLSRYTVVWSETFPRQIYFRFVDWTAVNPSPVYLKTPGLRWQ